MPRQKQTLHASGLVEVKVTVGKTIDGKRIQKSFYGTSKLAARNKADEYLTQQAVAEQTGQIIIRKDYTITEWAQKWLSAYKLDKVQSSTYKAIEKRLTNYVLPYIGKADLKNIRPIDIQAYFDSKEIFALSSSVKSKLKQELNSIFETAIDNDLCYKNPMKNIKLPEYQKVIKKSVYTQSEQGLIIKYCMRHECGKDIAIMLKTGLRRGELLALTWDDIDFKENTIRVNKALKDTSGSPTVGAPKTKAGNRTILFDNELKRIFLSMNRQLHYKKDGKAIILDSPYIIHSAHGKMHSPSNWMHRIYEPTISEIVSHYEGKGICLDKLSPHELRHSYGTTLYDNGVDLRTIQKMLGHASLEITSNLYVHDNLDTMRKSMKLK